MSKKHFMPTLRHFRLFLTLLISTILIMAYQGYKGAIRPLDFLGVPMNFLSDSVKKTGSSLSLLKRITVRDKEIKVLETELNRLRLENQLLKEIEIENTRLRELILLKERQSGYLTTARVIGRKNNPWANMFIIDKGSRDSISKDMAVITPKGLLGKVQDVYELYSSVLLIDDIRFKAAVRLQASRVEAIFSGTGLRGGKIDYIDIAETVKKDEVVVTSGLDGIFAAGLSIGYVSDVLKTEGKPFQDIDVTPFVDTRKVEEVVILR